MYGWSVNETDWEDRISAAWAAFDELSEADFLAQIEKLAADLPSGSLPAR
jgi:hypothetical protein